MNKRIVTFVGLFLLSAAPISMFAARPVQRNIITDSAIVKKIISSPVASLLLGGSIGVATGSLIKYLEKGVLEHLRKECKMESPAAAFVVMLLSLAIESEVCNDLVVGLQSELDGYQIEHKKGLMSKTAQIAALLTYLRA